MCRQFVVRQEWIHISELKTLNYFKLKRENISIFHVNSILHFKLVRLQTTGLTIKLLSYISFLVFKTK